jgi:hypothetical protein
MSTSNAEMYGRRSGVRVAVSDGQRMDELTPEQEEKVAELRLTRGSPVPSCRGPAISVVHPRDTSGLVS